MTDDRLKLILEVDDKGFARVLGDAAKAGDRFELSLNRLERGAKDAGDGLETGLFSKLNAGALLLGGFGLAATLATEAVTTLWRESAAEAEAAGRRTEAALSATFEGLESLGRRTFESREALLDAAQQQQQRVLELEQQFRRDLGLGRNAPDILVRFNATAEGIFDGNIRASRALLEEERARLRVLQSELESYDDQGRELARLQQSGAEVVETEQKKDREAKKTLSTFERQVQAVLDLRTNIESISAFEGTDFFSDEAIAAAQNARLTRERIESEFEQLDVTLPLSDQLRDLQRISNEIDISDTIGREVESIRSIIASANLPETLRQQLGGIADQDFDFSLPQIIAEGIDQIVASIEEADIREAMEAHFEGIEVQLPNLSAQLRTLNGDIDASGVIDSLRAQFDLVGVDIPSIQDGLDNLKREIEGSGVKEAFASQVEDLQLDIPDFSGVLDSLITEIRDTDLRTPYESKLNELSRVNVDLSPAFQSELDKAQEAIAGFSPSFNLSGLERSAQDIDISSGILGQFSVIENTASSLSISAGIDRAAERLSGAGSIDFSSSLASQFNLLEDLAGDIDISTSLNQQLIQLQDSYAQVDLTSRLRAEAEEIARIRQGLNQLPDLERPEREEDPALERLGVTLSELSSIQREVDFGITTEADATTDSVFVLRDALRELVIEGIGPGNTEFDVLRERLAEAEEGFDSLATRPGEFAAAASVAFGSFAQLSQQAFEQSEGNSRAWFNFNKGVLIAQATADTFAGANRALAQGGPFGIITGAAVIAAGLANVARIASTRIGGGSVSGGGGGSTLNFSPFTAGNGSIETLARPNDQTTQDLQIASTVLPSGDILLAVERGLDRRARFGGDSAIQEGR